MKLTIIVTVYNKEKYLRRALESVLLQEHVSEGDYEVMVVNDGSDDGSPAIIEEYAERDSRIRVLTQQNQGLSIARNNGVKAAKGDYIWFVDADDSVSPESVASIVEAIDQSPDIIPIYAKNNDSVNVTNAIPAAATSGRDILLSGKWRHCGPFYVYKRSFLIDNGLFYYPGIYHEDSELTPRLLYYAKSAVVVDKVLYTIYADPDSITRVPKVKRAYDNIFVASRLKDFCDDFLKDDVELRKVFDSSISTIINNAFKVIVHFSKQEQQAFNHQLFPKRELLKSLKDSGQLKYGIEYYVFTIFQPRYTEMFRLLRKCAGY